MQKAVITHANSAAMQKVSLGVCRTPRNKSTTSKSTYHALDLHSAAVDTFVATTSTGTAVRVPLSERGSIHTTSVDLLVHSCTVLMGRRKAIFLEIHYFHVLTSPLGRKFHADSKNGLKKFHMISEGPKFFD